MSISGVPIIGEDVALAEFKGKRVLLRADLNLPMRKEGNDGKITDDSRLTAMLPTVRALRDAGARVLVMSHLGRPKGEANKDFSLLPVRDLMEKHLDVEIPFADDCIGGEARLVSDSLQDGEVALLENLRFHKGETENNAKFAKSLAGLADIYVNDGFSVSHRSHASVDAVTAFLPSYGGLSMAEELRRLHEVCEAPEKPLALIIGGAKISSKIKVIKNLIDKIDYLIIGGGMANTFLLAKGVEVGASLVEGDLCDVAIEILALAESKGVKVILPNDVVVSGSLDGVGGIRSVSISAVGDDDMILDIGGETVAEICAVLGKCKTVLWNGPLGAFEHVPFGEGTFKSMEYAGELTGGGGLRSIAGGGDTGYALKMAKAYDKFSYVSGAGGAFLEYLEGGDLPGIAALKFSAVIVV